MRRFSAVRLLALLSCFWLVLPAAVHRASAACIFVAHQIAVTNLDDSGPGSLRQAIADAACGDTITVAVTGTITLTSGELAMGGYPASDSRSNGRDLTIQGPGADKLTVSGKKASRVFRITAGTVTLESITIADGAATVVSPPANGGGGVYVARGAAFSASDCTFSRNGIGNGDGGGIFNHGGKVTLTRCTFFGNGNGGGCGGGIWNDDGGTANLTSCTLLGNGNYTLLGHGIPVGCGGGIWNGGTATLTSCTLSGNNSGAGGGIFCYGTATLTGCTLSGNSAGYGGGIKNGPGTTSLTNCTLSGNSAHLGGGIDNGGTPTFTTSSTVTLANCTLSGNSASYGGGIDNGGPLTFTNGTVTLANCVIARSGVGRDIYRDHLTNPLDVLILSQGHNLIDDASYHLTGPGDLNDVPALIGPLANNGGATRTCALLAPSPAIAGGEPYVAGTTVATDERGRLR